MHEANLNNFARLRKHKTNGKISKGKKQVSNLSFQR